jgi:hypothetical protein
MSASLPQVGGYQLEIIAKLIFVCQLTSPFSRSRTWRQFQTTRRNAGLRNYRPAAASATTKPPDRKRVGHEITPVPPASSPEPGRTRLSTPVTTRPGQAADANLIMAYPGYSLPRPFNCRIAAVEHLSVLAGMVTILCRHGKIGLSLPQFCQPVMVSLDIERAQPSDASRLPKEDAYASETRNPDIYQAHSA